MKKKEYLSKRKNNKPMNILIILIGVAAIMLTGFAYASKLQSIDDYSYSKIQEEPTATSENKVYASQKKPSGER